MMNKIKPVQALLKKKDPFYTIEECDEGCRVFGNGCNIGHIYDGDVTTTFHAEDDLFAGHLIMIAWIMEKLRKK